MTTFGCEFIFRTPAKLREFSKKIGELFKAVKDRFSKEKEDKNASKTLEAFEKEPEEWIGPMKSILTKMISTDPEFSALLEKLVDESENEAVKAGTVNNFETMVTGGYIGKIINIGTIEGDVDL